jgi:hypothetical protein
MLRKGKTCLSIIVISTIFAATTVTLTGIGSIGIAQGQLNSASELTPEQKAAICDPSDTHINGTESRICGIPKTPSSNTTTSEDTTTGAEGSPTDLAPSATPPSE